MFANVGNKRSSCNNLNDYNFNEIVVSKILDPGWVTPQGNEIAKLKFQQTVHIEQDELDLYFEVKSNKI